MKAMFLVFAGLVACGGTTPESLVGSETKGGSETVSPVPADLAPNAPSVDSGAVLADGGAGDALSAQNDSGSQDAGADSGLPACLSSVPVGACLSGDKFSCLEFYQLSANGGAITPEKFCNIGAYVPGKTCADLMDANRETYKCYVSSDLCSTRYRYSDLHMPCNGIEY